MGDIERSSVGLFDFVPALEYSSFQSHAAALEGRLGKESLTVLLEDVESQLDKTTPSLLAACARLDLDRLTPSSLAAEHATLWNSPAPAIS